MKRGELIKIKNFEDIDISLYDGPVCAKEMQKYCGLEDRIFWLSDKYVDFVRLKTIPYVWNKQWLYSIDDSIDKFSEDDFKI